MSAIRTVFPRGLRISSAVHLTNSVTSPLVRVSRRFGELRNKLFIKPTEVFSAVSLNLKLKLKYSSTELNGARKMNDISAVELFSIDNLITLFDANQSAINLSET
jgi:hypothetical protein